MKSFTFRLDDEIAEALLIASKNAGCSPYIYTAQVVTEHLRQQETEVIKQSEFRDEMRTQMMTQRFNVRFIGQVLMALLSAQIGEDESRKICAEISTKLKNQEGIQQ